ncbi:MAG: WD40/YVTN/BNR-like repeat-containing protein, partial [bacterium]
TDIVVHGRTIWFGTGAGLSKTSDQGRSFVSFGTEQGLGKGGVSGLAVSDEIIWVATGFDTLTEVGLLQAGGGLAYSLDDGETWTFVPQPGVTNIQNITFDIALRGSEVWITSFGGGLRKSVNFGQSWQIVTPDSFIFDPGHILNHRAFSVITVDSILWVGTAGGINKSTDGGSTWTNFNHANQAEPISGNFVVALANQRFRGKDIIWAATIETTVETEDTTEFRGISWSEDQGFTWRTALPGEFAHNFAFSDSVVYVATNNGLFKSIDRGETWALFPNIVNPSGTRRILAHEFFAVGVSPGDTVWVGTADGLARTSDNGLNWEIFQTFESTAQESSPRTYAYPNPFSPNVHNVLDGIGHVRFQYNTTRETRVTLKIYDFAMQLVTTVVNDKPRPANGDFYEIWDAKDSRGVQVDNGVYFYRLDLEGEGRFWGKIIVLN